MIFLQSSRPKKTSGRPTLSSRETDRLINQSDRLYDFDDRIIQNECNYQPRTYFGVVRI